MEYQSDACNPVNWIDPPHVSDETFSNPHAAGRLKPIMIRTCHPVGICGLYQKLFIYPSYSSAFSTQGISALYQTIRYF